MSRNAVGCVIVGLLASLAATGCQSPYRADQGALVGGLLGAGTGALIGDANGNAGAGAAIGAGLGAITGAVVGSELDEIDAQNRAMIAQQLGRQVSADAVRVEDVVAMTQAGVDPDLIASHVRIHGVSRPLQTGDLIFLQQQGVSKTVIRAMQEPPPQPARPVVVREAAPPPVVIHEYSYGPPYWDSPWYPRPYRPRHRTASGVTWGISVRN